eukprot:g3462.t1
MSMKFQFAIYLLFAFCSIVSGATFSTDMVAPYLVYSVPRGIEIDVVLQGHSFLNKKYSPQIVEADVEGVIAHPADVYCKYGIEPKFHTKDYVSRSASVDNPEEVTCTKKSLLVYTYAPNKVIPSERPMDTISYTNTDAVGNVSFPGVVHFVNENRILAASYFNRNTDNWSVVQNGSRSVTVTFDPSSRGRMNRFVFAEEDYINKDSETGNDLALWYFKAPTKFVGDKMASYGGEIRFTLASFAGDFDQSNWTDSSNYIVKLECESCRTSASQDKGTQLYFPSSALQQQFDGKERDFVIALNENAGWLKDSENTQTEWLKPTQCEMIQVLRRLSGFHILGDHTKGFESISLDNVEIRAGQSTQVPGSRACNASAHYFSQYS